jgi:hypothetical protein
MALHRAHLIIGSGRTGVENAALACPFDKSPFGVAFSQHPGAVPPPSGFPYLAFVVLVFLRLCFVFGDTGK